MEYWNIGVGKWKLSYTHYSNILNSGRNYDTVPLRLRLFRFCKDFLYI